MPKFIDSDKDKPRARLNSTKKRVTEEFEERGQFVWITQGREIENYISEGIYKEVVSSLYNVSKDKLKHSQYGKMTVYGGEKKIDKIRLAHEVATKSPDFSALDLEKQLQTLTEEIKKANLIDV